MQLHSMVVDNFLGDFESVRNWADGAQYKDVANPIDGVVYPGICTDIPEALRNEIHYRLQAVLSGRVDIKTIFARLSLAGVDVPHQAHNDAVMGQFSFMLYLNRPEHCQGGTELVVCAGGDSGMEYGPANETEREEWERWTNWPEMWNQVSMCPMKSNRAFIFDARLMHRALPIGGFGKDAKDGRLVITAFFDLP